MRLMQDVEQLRDWVSEQIEMQKYIAEGDEELLCIRSALELFVNLYPDEDVLTSVYHSIGTCFQQASDTIDLSMKGIMYFGLTLAWALDKGIEDPTGLFDGDGLLAAMKFSAAYDKELKSDLNN